MATQTTNYHLSQPELTDNFEDFLGSYNDNMEIIDQNMGGGGGGGSGHTIYDDSGTAMPQRTGLQFEGNVNITDDSTNDKTIVEVLGGGSAKFDVVDLFENTSHASLSGVITLSDDIDNYDLVEFIVEDNPYYNYTSFAYDAKWLINSVPYVSDNPTGTFPHLFLTGYDNHYLRMTMGQTNDTMIIPRDRRDLMLYKIRGIKVSGGGGGSSSLAGLSDVSITSAQGGQVLKYDALNSEWVNANESGGGSYTAGDGIGITSNVISVDTAFTEAGTRQNIASGDTLATILGKIKKFFTDLKTVAFSGSYNDLSDKPTIPTATSDLVNDSDFVSDASYVHTDENFTSAEKTKLSGIEAGAEVNVQSDWNEADNTADDYIKNKPSIPTNTSDLNNDSGFLTSADVSTVAISGDYDDLLNKPTIPTKVSDLNNDSGFTSVSWNQIQATGTKIAEIDIDGTTTDVYSPAGSSATITLVVNCDSAFEGETLTLTQGGTSLTAVVPVGLSVVFNPSSLGTWVLTNTLTADSISISMNYYGQYSYTLTAIPDGSTVLPTDDVQILLNCADIWDKSYTTLSELLADSTTLQAVINSTNAIDYLVRSTTFATNMCADSSAMSYIGLNNYASNTLLADSTWCEAICNSTYFESVLNVKVPTMTSNTTPSGECFASSQYDSSYAPWKAFNGGSGSWISGNGQYANSYLGYIFTKNTKVYIAKIAQAHIYRTPKNYKFQAFDGVNWIDTTETLNPFNGTSTPDTVFNQFTKNVGSYPRYRLLIPTIQATSENIASVRVLQFYGRADV